MNTPAHLLVSLSWIGRKERPRWDLPIAVAAAVPDLPMLVFFLWFRYVKGEPSERIWGTLYFEADYWQLAFDVFNSIPLAVVVVVLGKLKGSRLWEALGLSLLLHSLLDLPLHHDDAHRHFLPLSNWRFESPISYWDPAHFGVVGVFIEGIAVAVASVVLWKRWRQLRRRWFVVATAAVYSLGIVAFAAWWFLGSQ